jgi:hypothetical protein
MGFPWLAATLEQPGIESTLIARKRRRPDFQTAGISHEAPRTAGINFSVVCYKQI